MDMVPRPPTRVSCVSQSLELILHNLSVALLLGGDLETSTRRGGGLSV